MHFTLAYDCIVVSLSTDFHNEQKYTLVVQTVSVVSGNGNGNVNKMSGKTGMGTKTDYGNGKRSHGNGRERESLYCSCTPLVHTEMGQHLAHVKFLLMLVNECVNLYTAYCR